MAKQHDAGQRLEKPRRVRRRFTAEFKADAVRLMQARRRGVSVAQIARELDVSAQQLQDWAKALGMTRADQSGGSAETLEQENRRLRRENEIL